MRYIFKKWGPILVASITGLVVLVGYLFPTPTLAYARDHIIEWGVIVAAFAFILGLLNLLRVHTRRIFRFQKGWPYSLILLLTASISWIPPVLYGVSHSTTRRLVDELMGPLGSSLAALLVFTLTLAAFRSLRIRHSAESTLFVVVVILVLLGSTPLVGLEWLREIRSWVTQVPAMAGMRGLLLGVALGIVITGLKVLLGSEHPHSEF